MAAFINVKIPSWEVYQERRDRKNYAWFKMFSDYFNNESVYDLDTHSKLVLIYLYTLRNKSDNEIFRVNLEKATLDLRMKLSDINKSLEILSNSDHAVIMPVEARALTGDSQADAGVMPSLERKKERKNTVLSDDRHNTKNLIEEIWAARPRRRPVDADPKKLAVAFLERLSTEKLEQILVATKAYELSYRNRQGQDRQFVPMFITWLKQGRFEDALEAAPVRKPEMAWDAEKQQYVELKNDA